MNNNKRIRYHHVHALRDLSRCRAFNGTRLKKGMLYRSGYLGKLSKEQAKEFVEEFNIGYVIDLRTDVEVESAPDMQCDEVKYLRFPVVERFDNPAITKENRVSILLDISKNKGGAVKYFDGIYRKMVSDEYSLNQFKQIFDVLLNKDDNKAIIFHCTQGKDRTGVLAALIFYALGVDKGSIYYDYKRFNNTYRFRCFLISLLAAVRFMSSKVSKDLYYIQMANRKLIQGTFDEIYKTNKDRYDFFNSKLGIDRETINKLREKYLIKN